MITFKQFLLPEEGPGAQLDVDGLMEACRPFIAALEGVHFRDHLPLHGTGSLTTDWALLSVKRRPKPRDSHPAVHAAINSFFTEQYGWAAREDAIFVTGNYAQAAEYGEPYLCLAVGEFKSLWSPDIHDLQDAITTVMRRLKHEHPTMSYDEIAVELLPAATVELLKECDWAYNTNLAGGLNAGVEIMLWAKQVYLIKYATPTYWAVVERLIAAGCCHAEAARKRHLTPTLTPPVDTRAIKLRESKHETNV
jgi:hypothetical protein